MTDSTSDGVVLLIKLDAILDVFGQVSSALPMGHVDCSCGGGDGLVKATDLGISSSQGIESLRVICSDDPQNPASQTEGLFTVTNLAVGTGCQQPRQISRRPGMAGINP